MSRSGGHGSAAGGGCDDGLDMVVVVIGRNGMVVGMDDGLVVVVHRRGDRTLVMDDGVGGGVMGVSMVVVPMAMIVMGVIGDRVGRSRVVVMVMAVGVRDRMVGRVVVTMSIRYGMGGVVVMPVRIMCGGGVIIMTRMAVFVVRLVLVAHLGSVPSRCSAVIAAKSV